MKKLTILFLSVLLLSYCPEKKSTQPKEKITSNEVIKVDSSCFQTIIKEYKELTDEDLNLI